ncbi:DNA-binding transcriptional regulator [Candidatus Obscuribacterales bacterium]|nr:DNA-binding transcriptional regulator [Candidatus Obscuribacterales bacterium]MBX3134976.1 DNA-binding transcriptional regulator [Candidatus Obscuribacterales bacterium]MBX3150723.1 DNA-binding transcriptional regulator [Candidatus Obscuribacterales bacterium]
MTNKTKQTMKRQSKAAKPAAKPAKRGVTRNAATKASAGRTSLSRTTQANKSTTPSGISGMVYETAKGLYDAGSIDKTTMREFDTLCLPKVPNYTAVQIKAIRTRCKLSQHVFAAYMNVSASSLQKWERGERKPDGVALKLLNLVDKKGLQALVV